ncbi:hypothetical protein [Planctomycetes bacterium K23_9]|uniref:Uncharacterized protein n=1 Tax=Stieleria marina TaxID=1930275 RepID=A0A517NTM1_9BACT|nr:hypothetical protein K239x_24280 [Planctomycetes bacterium K23_9]
MIVAHCPRCAEAIRVPSAQLPDDAYAQCPLCRETFAAAELLDRLPPMVQFIGADGEPMQIQEHAVAALHGEASIASDDEIGEIQDVDQGGLFTDAAGSVAAAGGALAAGTLAAGAAALGLSQVDAEDDVEELNEIEEYLENDDDVTEEDGTDNDSVNEKTLDAHSLNETLDDDDVEQYLDEVAAVDEDSAEETSTESTTLMDTMTEEDGAYAAASSGEEVDVEEEVQQFLADDETIEFESHAPEEQFSDEPASQESGLVVEDVDLEEHEFNPSEIVTSDGAGAAAPAMPMKVRSRPPIKRKKASPLKTLASIALGPLLALPLAGGVLLAIGKAPDLGFWPFLGNSNTNSGTMAAAPVGTSGPAATTQRSDSFGESTDLVPADSPLGQFVADNAATDGNDSSAATAGNEQVPADDSTGENSTSDASSFSMPANNPSTASDVTDDLPAATNAATTDSTTPDSSAGFSDPFGRPSPTTEDVAAPQANKMPEAVTPDPAVPEPTEIATPKPKDPDFTDFSKQAASRDDLDSVFGMTDSPKASSNKAAIDDPFGDGDSTASSKTNRSDLPSMPSGLPALGGSDDSPFGEGVTLDGPAETDSPELIDATKKASQAMLTLLKKRAAGTDQRRDLGTAYARICPVGAIEANSNSVSLRNLLAEIGDSTLLDEFAGDPPVVWLGLSKRPTDGILLIGTMSGTKTAPQVTLSDGSAVSITIADANRIPATGMKVIGIGKIVSQDTVALNAIFSIK